MRWPATFQAATAETVEGILAACSGAIEKANRHIAGCSNLNDPARPAAGKNTPLLRWALVHMIEETGRHAGHADGPLDALRGLAAVTAYQGGSVPPRPNPLDHCFPSLLPKPLIKNVPV